MDNKKKLNANTIMKLNLNLQKVKYFEMKRAQDGQIVSNSNSNRFQSN